ncbi:MAG: hypothetical protein WAW17_09020 [Rhodococcus sp. (in: high G+C Gram-positive bacteria)]|uniref:hypothetical protein n=1 Tax=Rhodococcus sp. TaxID=1831 RepID=UPI003BAF3A76
MPFLLVLLRAFNQDERRKAARIDAELDAAELQTPVQSPVPAGTDADTPAVAGRPRVWWEDDPQLRERFRRG